MCDVGTETNDPEVEDNTPKDVDSLPIGDVEADATALLMEQEQDPRWLRVGPRHKQTRVDL